MTNHIRTFKQVDEQPTEGRFGAIYMHGEDMWAETFQWSMGVLWCLDQNGEPDYSADFSDCEFKDGIFFVEHQP